MFSYLKKWFGDRTTIVIGGNSEPIDRNDTDCYGTSLVTACPPAYHCIDLVSNRVSQTKIHCYKNTEKGKEVDENHPVEDILTSNWNPLQNSIDGLQSLIANCLFAGNGYAWIERDEIGNAIALYNLDPREVEISFEYDEAKLIGVYYVLRTQYGYVPLLQEDVLHIKNCTINSGMFGISIIDQLSGTLRHNHDLQTYSTNYFKNGAHINKWISVPDWIPKEEVEDFNKQIETMKAGLKNAHKVAVLQNGMTLNSLQLNNDEAQFIESKNYSNLDIATIFGLFGAKVNVAVGTSANSLQEQELQLASEVYGKFMRKFEIECKKLFPLSQRKSKFVEFKREDLLSMDQKAKYEMAIALKNNGIYTDVETRLMLNMCKPEYAEGQFSAPANLIDPYAPIPTVTAPDNTPLNAQNQPPEAQPPVDEPKDSPSVAEIANGVIERWKTRIIRSKNVDLASHIEILLESLPGFNKDTILDQVEKLDLELQAVLPEQRETIIKEWNLNLC